MKESRSTPIEYISMKHGPISQATHEEGQPLRDLQGVVQEEVFSAESTKVFPPHNVVNHNKNLHGGPGVEGYTGFYKGIYRDKGVPRLPKKK